MASLYKKTIFKKSYLINNQIAGLVLGTGSPLDSMEVIKSITIAINFISSITIHHIIQKASPKNSAHTPLW